MEKRISHFYSRAVKHARSGPGLSSFGELGEAASAVVEAAVAPSAAVVAGTATVVAETAMEAAVGAGLVTGVAVETTVEVAKTVAETATEAAAGAGLVTEEVVETTVEADSGSSNSFSYEDSEEESEEIVSETRLEVGLDKAGPTEVPKARPVDPFIAQFGEDDG